jgi:hypothetical protein
LVVVRAIFGNGGQPLVAGLSGKTGANLVI